MTFQEKVKRFAGVLEAAQLVTMKAEAAKRGSTWMTQNYRVTIVPGRKYFKVDVGPAGKYMVAILDETIWGIKGYGVIHRGHQYGTLDTLHEWDWGGYIAIEEEANL